MTALSGPKPEPNGNLPWSVVALILIANALAPHEYIIVYRFESKTKNL